MRKPLFTGVCTALITPFKGNTINYAMMETLLQRQLDAGIKAIVIAGTTGESSTLTDSEKIELFQRCKEYVGNKCLIIAGTGSNDTKHSAELSIAAQEASADGILVVSPYYNKATAAGVVQHYTAISQSVSIPVIVYNVPGRTGLDIPVSVYRELSSISNIAGVKEASSDITKIAKIRNECGQDFPVWSGNDDQIVPVMALGGKGVISVLSNIKPAETQAMCDAALRGDFTTASRLQCEYLPLIDFLFCEVNPIPVKAMMKQIGFDCGGYRLPLCDLSKENEEKMRKFCK
jgi:4-hydroxy-tetrahydrodipicolinate synthase